MSDKTNIAIEALKAEVGRLEQEVGDARMGRLAANGLLDQARATAEADARRWGNGNDTYHVEIERLRTAVTAARGERDQARLLLKDAEAKLESQARCCGACDAVRGLERARRAEAERDAARATAKAACCVHIGVVCDEATVARAERDAAKRLGERMMEERDAAQAGLATMTNSRICTCGHSEVIHQQGKCRAVHGSLSFNPIPCECSGWQFHMDVRGKTTCCDGECCRKLVAAEARATAAESAASGARQECCVIDKDSPCVPAAQLRGRVKAAEAQRDEARRALAEARSWATSGLGNPIPCVLVSVEGCGRCGFPLDGCVCPRMVVEW